MKTIFRYRLDITDAPFVSMPLGARVLPAPPNSRNSDYIEIWAEVDTTQPLERRDFRIVGTGSPLPDDCGDFVGTVMTHGGSLVWHIFEAKEQ